MEETRITLVREMICKGIEHFIKIQIFNIIFCKKINRSLMVAVLAGFHYL